MVLSRRSVTLIRCCVRRMCSTAESTTPKPKEGRLKRIGNYFLRILDDYKMVAEELAQDMKERPIKSAVYISLLGITGVLYKTNPSETDFREILIKNNNDLLRLGDPIRNPTSDSHMQKLTWSYNEDRLRRFSIGIISVMWLDHFNRDIDLYAAKAPPLKIGWLDFKDYIVDIGILGRWVWIQEAMKDYDINPIEWNEEPAPCKIESIK